MHVGLDATSWHLRDLRVGMLAEAAGDDGCVVKGTIVRVLSVEEPSDEVPPALLAETGSADYPYVYLFTVEVVER